MPMATIRKVSEDLYHIHFLDAVDPGYGRPGGGHPDHDLPGRPPHVGGGPIYHPGHPDHGLPSHPGHPANRPPGSGGGIPDNSLPSHPPPHVPPGTTLVLVRDPAGVWHYATLAPGTPPPTTLPEPTPPPGVDNTLPPTPPPHVSGGPVPPTPTPQRR